MTVQLLPASSSKHSVNVECRVYQRFACGLATACQPIAARGDNDMSWQGEILNISLGGVGLLLRRRFERGAGLAIEIPETTTAPADTLLVKVVHATAKPDGQWLLGCMFVSPLGEDELHRLIRLAQEQNGTDEQDTVVENRPNRTPMSPRNSFLIHDVTWQGSFADTARPEARPPVTNSRLVRRFHLTGNWPLAGGTVLRVWFGKTPAAKARIRIDRCYQGDGRWFVDYTFLDVPDVEVVRSFGH